MFFDDSLWTEEGQQDEEEREFERHLLLFLYRGLPGVSSKVLGGFLEGSQGFFQDSMREGCSWKSKVNFRLFFIKIALTSFGFSEYSSDSWSITQGCRFFFLVF